MNLFIKYFKSHGNSSFIEMKSFVVLVLLTVVSCVLCNPRENVIPKFFRNIGHFEYSDYQGVKQMKTYYVSRELKMNWVNAFMFCRSFDMDLAELTTEEEADKFLKLFGDHATTLEIWYHVGGSYMGVAKNDFYWMTTAKQISYPLKFYPGQPDNYLGKEKCLSIAKYVGPYLFYDVDCYDTWIWNFVCQKIEKYSDREGIRHIKTYYVSRELRLNWANSFMFCRSFGMDLVELTTEVESDKFLKLFGDHTKTLETWYHIGGSYMGAAKNDFYWMTTGKRISYPLKFHPGLPDNYLGKEKCLSILNQPGSFTLNDVDCYDTWIWNFVCQKIDSVSQIDPKSSFVKHRH
ncbi:unnamed protein product [Diamesa hyperborea]